MVIIIKEPRIFFVGGNMEYMERLIKNAEKYQRKLDLIILEKKGQIVGDGYLDIIVDRNNYEKFIDALTKEEILIEGITWWLYCDNTLLKTDYGYGGPKSWYFSGWFSELCNEFDEINVEKIRTRNANNYVEIINKEYKTLIKNKKTQKYSDGKHLSFIENKELMPGFWILVPNEWKNGLQRIGKN